MSEKQPMVFLHSYFRLFRLLQFFLLAFSFNFYLKIVSFAGGLRTRYFGEVVKSRQSVLTANSHSCRKTRVD